MNPQNLLPAAYYAAFIAQISEILARHDPLDISFGQHNEEYTPKIKTIVPHLESATSAEALQDIIHRQFCAWFGAGLTGPKARYAIIAKEIWTAWHCLREPGNAGEEKAG